MGLIFFLFTLFLFLNRSVSALNDLVEKNVSNDASENEKYGILQSRTINQNSNSINLDIDPIKGLIQKVTNLPSAIKNNDTLDSQINFSQNLRVILEMLQKLENKNCIRDITYVLDGLTKSEKWALQMFDAFPKFPLGLLYGNLYQLGNFDECTNVHHLEDDDTQVLGQYCLADVTYKLKINNSGFSSSFENDHFNQNNRSKFNTSVIHWAICLPSTCEPQDGTILVKDIFTSLIGGFKTLDVIIRDKDCYYEKSEDVFAGEIIYGCIIAVFLLFIVFATLSHIFFLEKRKKCVTYNIDNIRSQNQISITKEIVFCFSLIQTVKKLLRTKPSDINLECIFGIKFLSMMFIIISHSLIFIFGGPMANANFPAQLYQDIEHGMFMNSPLLVDTFLLVSGFLMCRLLLLELDKRKGRINVLLLYITRYLRLTPAYLVVIGLYLTWLPKLGDGPLWKKVVYTENERCLNSWWTNLLYINNYVRTDSLCMFQAWYLAVDYHLFIIAPFIIYPVWKWSRIGMTLLSVLTICAAILPAYFTLKDNLDPTLLAFPPEIQDISTNFYFVNAYIKTHIRASSYFLGLVFGYIVHQIQSTGTKIPKWVIWVGWILAVLFGISSMFSIVIFFEPNYTSNSIESAVYAPLHRVAWCLAIGWIIVMCVTDNAATVNKFLTWNFFVPLSRLTYCAYLVNGLVIIYHKGTIREAAFLSRFQLYYTLLGHLVLTFFYAFLLCICFESPIHGLEKILLRTKGVQNKHIPSTNHLKVLKENENT